MNDDTVDRILDALIENFILLGLIIILFGIGITLAGPGAVRGESSYTGYVADVEVERGLVMQTSQAHLKTDLRSSSAETFCIHPSNQDRQARELKEALRNNQRVTISYSRPLLVPLWECESGTSIVQDVEIANNTRQTNE